MNIRYILVFLMLTLTLFSNDKKLVNDATAFTFGNGKNEVLIVTDPECPFCKNLSKDKNDKFKNYKINIVLVALPYHKKAKQMISYILSAENNSGKYHRYKEIMLEDDTSYKNFKTDSSLVENYLKKSMLVVKNLGIDRVPAVFDNEEDDYFNSSYEEL